MVVAGLSELESAIRRAVAGGSYGEAQLLLARYCAVAGRAIRNRGPGEETRELASQVSGLLRWALRSACAGRAQCRLELSMVTSAQRYQAPRGIQATLRIDA